MTKSKKILVTGGAGYIGSHTCVALITQGYEIIVVDNFINSCPLALKRVEQITGQQVSLIAMDLLNLKDVTQIFLDYAIDTVLHFAGLKSVRESCEKPLRYYQNNLIGTLNLLQAMQGKCQKIIFSSSATVYGYPEKLPLTEEAKTQTINPYGASKLMIENILQDLYQADNSWHITILRYFNPVGAHHTGLIGESPSGIPNNLFPYIASVINKKSKRLDIFGNDYPTVDGTGVRDYIHVIDLALGHIKSLEKICGFNIYNLGTGKGYSVLEIVRAFEEVSQQKIPCQFVPRRKGDVAENYAEVSKIKNALGWESRENLHTMVEDSYRWIRSNPNGYL